jgi:hypothetical protein
METNSDKANLSERRNLDKTLHLTDNKTPRLHRVYSIRELSSKRILEMKNQFYTAVGQDSLRRCVVDRAITLQRPNAFYKRRESSGDWIFAIAYLAHDVVDSNGFTPVNSMSALGEPDYRCSVKICAKRQTS